MKVQIVSRTAQKFDGKTYYLCGFYYQRKGKRLHRVVWEHHNGAIPKGYHVHHIDGDRSNNDIDNLSLLYGRDHLSEHMRTPERREQSARAADIARPYANKWHGSEAGLAFHSKLSRENWEKREIRTYHCTNCGKAFETRHIYAEGKNHFCGNNCKAAFRRKSGVDDEERVCEVCGKTYTVNRYSKNKTCGRECGRKMRWGE